MPLYGIYRGSVTNTNDPENFGRLKAVVPQALGLNETDWAWPATPNIAGVGGLAIGDPVWITFEAGDPAHPVWVGTWLTHDSNLPGVEDVMHWMTRVTS